MLGITKHGYILNIQALGLVVSNKKIFHVFFYYKPMATVSPGMSYLDTSGMVGRIYKGNY